MHQLTKNILIINFVLFLISCKSTVNATQNYKVNTIVLKNYFDHQEKDYLYKGTIDIYGNPLTGIFVLKKISDLEYRCVFTTEFGNKLIDLKIFENRYEKVFIISDLDRKIVVETLSNDLQKLLFIQKNLLLKSENQNEIEFITNHQKENILYKTDQKGYISLISVIRNEKEQILFEINRENTEIANKISITHKDIKLIIHLNFFTE